MNKHFTRLALSAVMALAVNASWAFSFQAGNMYYNMKGTNSVEVTYATDQYNSYAGNITIPAKVENGGKTYDVVAIGDKAFYWS